MKKALLLALLLSLSFAGSADAHRRRSKIHGPFGSWTWGADIPHYHTPRPSDSCLGGGSPPCGHPDPTHRPTPRPSYKTTYSPLSI